MNTDSITKATNKPWEQWVNEIEAAGGRNMSHTELARKLYDELAGKIDSHGWWAQGITVAYEQHIGKRIPGQLANGLFELAVSRSVSFSGEIVFVKLEKYLSDCQDFNGQQPNDQRTSKTPKRSNWRCNFKDGSKFTATVEGTDNAKIIFSHTAIPSKKELDGWKRYWKYLLEKFTKTLQ